ALPHRKRRREPGRQRGTGRRERRAGRRCGSGAVNEPTEPLHVGEPKTEPIDRTGDRVDVIVVGDAAIDVHVKRTGELVVDGDSRAEIRTALGGAGANTAAWLASFDVATVLVARVGDDPAGRQVAAELPVSAALTVDPDAPTACVVVLVDERGRRTMLSD